MAKLHENNGSENDICHKMGRDGSRRTMDDGRRQGRLFADEAAGWGKVCVGTINIQVCSSASGNPLQSAAPRTSNIDILHQTTRLRKNVHQPPTINY
jgi:hypothetical protein